MQKRSAHLRRSLCLRRRVSGTSSAVVIPLALKVNEALTPEFDELTKRLTAAIEGMTKTLKAAPEARNIVFPEAASEGHPADAA